MKTIFGKTRSSIKKTKPSPLTPQFAQEVLDLEEQVNLNCTLPLVTRLISLYKSAIEYYQSEKNLKHIHYQDRLRALLSKTNVLQMFKAAKSPIPKSAPSTSPRYKIIVTELVVERNCDKVLKDHKVENSDVAKKIQDNLKLQSDSLSQRLTLRRNAHTPKHEKKFLFEHCATEEVASESPVEDYENEVEEILEKYVNEKKEVKKMIKEKYQEYFTETSQFHGSLGEQLAEELRKNMDAEIQNAVQDVYSRRNSEVALARRRLSQRV